MKEIEDTTAKAQMSKNTHLHTHTKKGCWEQVTAPYGIFAARIKMHSLKTVSECVCVCSRIHPVARLHTSLCVCVCALSSLCVSVCMFASTLCVCVCVCVCE